jgi:GH43 family beta-xylosidase
MFSLKSKKGHYPYLVKSAADPWVIYHDGYYYYCRVIDDWQIAVNKAKKLKDIGKKNNIVWQVPSGKPHVEEVWAPELHRLDGKWYIYFAWGNYKDHRMYVLESETDDPSGSYSLKGQITDPTNQWAIDGTVMEIDANNRYFIWSGWETEEDIQQNLYIAKMSNPWTISGQRVCISEPEYGWERQGKPLVNEGPTIIKKDGRFFLIYSASHSLTDEYCLGQLTLKGNDPLNKESWEKSRVPVFRKTDSVFGPGHSSFLTMPDGSDWIIYHSADYSGAGWARNVHAQRYSWNHDGTPHFGSPTKLRPSKRAPKTVGQSREPVMKPKTTH